MAIEHREQHREAGRSTPTQLRRRPAVGRREQGLHLEQQRTRALELAQTHEPAAPPGRSARNAADGLRDLAQAAAGHLEHAELGGAAEAVLAGAQEPERALVVAVERQHRVDEVLEHARAGELAVLGDVPDEHDRRAVQLGEADQLRRALRGSAPTLPGRPSARVAVDGLDRVDHDRRELAGERELARGREDRLDARLGEQQQSLVRRRRAASPARRPARSTPRRWRRAPRPRPRRCPPRPAAAASTCRCPVRRRPARRCPRPARRRARDRPRRCRCRVAGLLRCSRPRRPAWRCPSRARRDRPARRRRRAARSSSTRRSSGTCRTSRSRSPRTRCRPSASSPSPCAESLAPRLRARELAARVSWPRGTWPGAPPTAWPDHDAGARERPRRRAARARSRTRPTMCARA